MKNKVEENCVYLKNGSYYKHFSKSEGDFQLIVEKSLAFQEIKKSSFFFPKVKSFDIKNRCVEYEEIKNIKNIREFYINYMKGNISENLATDIFFKVGVALADIHNFLKLNTQQPLLKNKKFKSISQNNGLKFNGKHAFLHLDFGFSNIFVNSKNQICIIDPYSNGYSASKIVNAWGPVEFDIATFLMCLQGLVPFKNIFQLSNSKIQRLKNAFLYGYTSNTNQNIDLSKATVLTKLLYDTYIASRYHFAFERIFINPCLYIIKYFNEFVR